MRKPIPNHLIPEFRAFMDASDDDSLSEGEWQAAMEQHAAAFMKIHSVRGDRNAAFQQWVSPE